jgi:hypothetical protein
MSKWIEKPTEEGWYWVRGAYEDDTVMELWPHADRNYLSLCDEINSWSVGIDTDGMTFSKIEHPGDQC